MSACALPSPDLSSSLIKSGGDPVYRYRLYRGAWGELPSGFQNISGERCPSDSQNGFGGRCLGVGCGRGGGGIGGGSGGDRGGGGAGGLRSPAPPPS